MKSHFIYILFVLCSIPLLSQNGTVTGSVSDSETNEPLPGVNVVVKKADLVKRQLDFILGE